MKLNPVAGPVSDDCHQGRVSTGFRVGVKGGWNHGFRSAGKAASEGGEESRIR